MELGKHFWLKVAGLVILGGIVAMFVFLFIGAALLTWGVVGAIIVFGALLLAVAWWHDRREGKTASEWEELGTQ